jgi:D-2-hydroxyacid dehydrogenase (NADP+)
VAGIIGGARAVGRKNYFVQLLTQHAPVHQRGATARPISMTRILFAHRNSRYYVPRINERFPAVEVITAPDLPEAEHLLAEADVIVANGHPFNERRLALAPKLKWIQAMTTGTDAILGAGNLRADVLVTSTRGIHGPQMSEMAFMYMLNLARRFPLIHENKKRHVWERVNQVRLYGKTVVIVGLGLTAEALAPRCKAFGMQVLGVTSTPREAAGFDRTYPYAELHQAVAQADFVVVLAPYSAATDSLIDARVLDAMKSSAFLINLARGGLCDEAALIEALRAQKIAGAGLDVFRTEPLPPESPFWDLDNLLITAHSSGNSDDNDAMTWPIIETNLQCFLEGRTSGMINVVPH